MSVYDGDTITVAARLPFQTPDAPLQLFKVRLNGIDTPEMKGKGVSDREKELAKKAKVALSKHILGKLVTFENVQLEKYGRVLCDVISDKGVNMNHWLVKRGYAKKYDGGTKDREWK